MYDLLAELVRAADDVAIGVDSEGRRTMLPRSPAPRTQHRAVRQLAVAAWAASIALALVACSGGSTPSSDGTFGFPEVQQSTAEITVWADNTRIAATDAFKAANPDVKINVVTFDGSSNGSGSFKQKIQLFDKAKKGWPDVVFSSQNNDASWASQANVGSQPFAAVLNKGYIDSTTIDGFTGGALAPCTVAGKVYCLRNDLASVVFWYDKTLFTKFGYAVPTTWEDYETLSAKVAADHPGYILGSVGDSFAPEIYFWAGKCQANDVTGPKAITVKTTTSDCKRVASMLDSLIDNGTMAKESVFTPEFVQKYAGKVLAMPGPSWYSGAIFNSKDSLNVPAGQIAAGQPLSWKGDEKVTGNVGGGTWFVSSHSKNLAAAKKFVTFVTTSDAYQVDLAPGLPAYASASAKWVAKQEASGYFSGDLAAVTDSASEVWDGWGSPSFSQEAIWSKTVTPGITAGKSITELLDAWGPPSRTKPRSTATRSSDPLVGTGGSSRNESESRRPVEFRFSRRLRVRGPPCWFRRPSGPVRPLPGFQHSGRQLRRDRELYAGLLGLPVQSCREPRRGVPGPLALDTDILRRAARADRAHDFGALD